MDRVGYILGTFTEVTVLLQRNLGPSQALAATPRHSSAMSTISARQAPAVVSWYAHFHSTGCRHALVAASARTGSPCSLLCASASANAWYEYKSLHVCHAMLPCEPTRTVQVMATEARP